MNTDIDKEKLNVRELAVYELIAEATEKGKKITQLQIVLCERWLGCHPKYESDTGSKMPTQQSTLRQVRQVIRDLRIRHHAKILSDVKGYWIPQSQDEVDAYMSRLEHSAKKSARAFLTTYHAMRKVFGVHSKYFQTMELDFNEAIK